MATKDDADPNLPSDQVLSEGVHGSLCKRMLRHVLGQLRRGPSIMPRNACQAALPLFARRC